MITTNQLHVRFGSKQGRTHARTNGTLECAKNESEHDETSKIVEGGTDHTGNRPSEEAKCDPSVHWESYQGVD